jgi:signal transduction histidine kinase
VRSVSNRCVLIASGPKLAGKFTARSLHGGKFAGAKQIVWNLLSNAVKFTLKGRSVHVLLERVNSHMKISVIDNGMGIKPEFLPHVFDRFRQPDSSTTRRHGGLGLGLAIVRQLVEIHDGTVKSEEFR